MKAQRKEIKSVLIKALGRLEDKAFLTGHGQYVDDIQLAGMLHASVLRSPYAHARIRRINTEKARQLPGVAAVLTGQDISRLSGTLPDPSERFHGIRSVDGYCLAVDKARFVGDAVAVVAASDRYTSEDALEAIEIEYEPLNPVVDPEDALKKGGPLVYEEWGDNVMLHFTHSKGEVEAAFKSADFTFKERIRSPRSTGTPIETRGYVADFAPFTNRFTVWASTQTAHIDRSLLSRTLHLPESKIEVIATDVGGGFGLKLPFYPEEVLVCLLSMQTGKPVKWIERRTESFSSTYHARDQTHYIEVAVRKDGKVLAVKDKIMADLGALGHLRTNGWISVLVAAEHVLGAYKIPNFAYDLYGVVTNKSPYTAYRGFGKTESAFVIELMMDIVASKLGIDPVTIRQRNFVEAIDFPYTSAGGSVLDSGDYQKCTEEVLRIADYDSLRKEQAKSRHSGRYLGIGFTLVLEPAAGGAKGTTFNHMDCCTVRLDESGRVSVLVSTASIGTGHKTALAQVVANELGVNLEDINVVEGNTSISPYGLGTWSSRFSVATTPAAILATRDVKKKATRIASCILGVEPERLEARNGSFSIIDSSKSIPYSVVAKAAHTLGDWSQGSFIALPDDLEPGLEATRSYSTPIKGGTYSNYPYSGNVAVVEVDPETGRVKLLKYVVVHDCGNMVNPDSVAAQVTGGTAQGIGGALYEELLYSGEGQLLTSNFMDYMIPTAMELPNIDVGHLITPAPFILGGFKGCGESGAIGAPVTVANAVNDAIRSVTGAYLVDLPASPTKVLKALTAK